MKNDEYARLGMMSIFTVSFFGHRYVDNINKVEDQLETLLRKLLSEHEYCEFLVGRDGDFDQCVSSAIVRTKRTYRDDISVDIFSDEYMDKINAIQLPNTKIKILERLLAQAIDEFKKVNKIMGIEFSERLKRVVDEYNNRRRDEA